MSLAKIPTKQNNNPGAGCMLSINEVEKKIKKHKTQRIDNPHTIRF